VTVDVGEDVSGFHTTYNVDDFIYGVVGVSGISLCGRCGVHEFRDDVRSVAWVLERSCDR
jgi:hypothetical protein